jgi:hypothetical protein
MTAPTVRVLLVEDMATEVQFVTDAKRPWGDRLSALGRELAHRLTVFGRSLGLKASTGRDPKWKLSVEPQDLVLGSSHA